VLDRRFVADNVDLIIANCTGRGSTANVARFAALDKLRRQFQADIDRLNGEAGQISKSIGKAADAAEREAKKAEGRRLREEISALETKSAEIVAEADAILRTIPNLTHPAAPVGGEDAAVEVRRGDRNDAGEAGVLAEIIQVRCLLGAGMDQALDTGFVGGRPILVFRGPHRVIFDHECFPIGVECVCHAGASETFEAWPEGERKNVLPKPRLRSGSIQ
jgi:hypothetical protein